MPYKTTKPITVCDQGIPNECIALLYFVLLSCHVMFICVCVYFLGFVNMVVVVYLFLYLFIYLFTYGWYAMNYNFMPYKITKPITRCDQGIPNEYIALLYFPSHAV